jgi:hypothetical protein
MAAQSPGIDMDSDAGAGADGGGAGAPPGPPGGDRDPILRAVVATRLPAGERDRLLLERLQRARSVQLARWDRAEEEACLRANLEPPPPPPPPWPRPRR